MCLSECCCVFKMAATPSSPKLRFHRNARVPFCAQLAREFGRSKGHVRRVILGERSTSPLAADLHRRQSELLAAARR